MFRAWGEWALDIKSSKVIVLAQKVKTEKENYSYQEKFGMLVAEVQKEKFGGNLEES